MWYPLAGRDEPEVGSKIGVGEDVEPSPHLFEEPLAPKSPQVLPGDVVAIEVTRPQHTYLSNQGKSPLLDWGEVWIVVSHVVSKCLLLPVCADVL